MTWWPPATRSPFPKVRSTSAFSCECFEHDEHWPDTFRNMYAMTRKGGGLVFTSACTGRLEQRGYGELKRKALGRSR